MHCYIVSKTYGKKIDRSKLDWDTDNSLADTLKQNDVIAHNTVLTYPHSKLKFVKSCKVLDT